MDEAAQREMVVKAARSMMGTPWRHMGRWRAGVDCGGLLIVVFKECGLVDAEFETGFYPPDFMMHSDEQRFRSFVERFADKAEREPKDGDVALFQVGRVIAHCAIVDQWPRIIHAFRHVGVCYDDADKGLLRNKFRGVWSLRGWS